MKKVEWCGRRGRGAGAAGGEVLAGMWIIVALLFWCRAASGFSTGDVVLSRRNQAGRLPPLAMVSRWSLTALNMATAKSGGIAIEDEETFERLVLSPNKNDEEGKALLRPVLVFYSAPWCGPCRLSIPVVRDIKKQFSHSVDFVEVCTDDLPNIAAEAGVVSIPTIQMYYDGELYDTIVGCVAKNVLASALTKVLDDVLGPYEKDDPKTDVGTILDSQTKQP